MSECECHTHSLTQLTTAHSRNHNARSTTPQPRLAATRERRGYARDVARGGASWGAHAAKTQKRRGMFKEKLYECQLMSVASFTDYTEYPYFDLYLRIV